MPIKISLKAARVNANLTLKEASDKIGVCETTLIKWEKNPSIVKGEYQKRISETYNIPIDCIIFLPIKSS